MENSNTEKEAMCFLQLLPSFYGKELRKLKQQFLSFTDAVNASESELLKVISKAQTFELIKARELHGIKASYASLINAGIGYYTLYDSDYPQKLCSIPSPPISLFVKGHLPYKDVPSVAIIGARNCSGYGRQMAREFSREIANNGIQIISGMAVGIDSVAEQSAFDVGGVSYGILGSGVDICFPAANNSLYNRTILHGGVISEYRPQTQPRSQHFPARNRIISGLADAVIVIEARERSGTLITVNMALEQGRDIYALPGRVNDSLSYGCNMLIKDGAIPLLRPHEFVEQFLSHFDKETTSEALANPCTNNKNTEAINNLGEKFFLTADERNIMSVLDYIPKSASEIYYELSIRGVCIALPSLLQLLTNMTIQHKVKCIDGTNYSIYA